MRSEPRRWSPMYLLIGVFAVPFMCVVLWWVDPQLGPEKIESGTTQTPPPRAARPSNHCAQPRRKSDVTLCPHADRNSNGKRNRLAHGMSSYPYILSLLAAGVILRRLGSRPFRARHAWPPKTIRHRPSPCAEGTSTASYHAFERTSWAQHGSVHMSGRRIPLSVPCVLCLLLAQSAMAQQPRPARR